MDSIEILKQSISALFDQLNEAEAAVDATAACYESAQAASRMYQEDQRLLRDAIANCRERLKRLNEQVKRPGGPPVQGQSSWWKELSEVRGECAIPFAECLAFALGPLVRGIPWQGSRGLDNGLCNIADEMLNELSVRTPQSWSRRTVLSDSEFMTDPAQIIRLRFPVTSIWDLPIAAHEFGHLLGLSPKSRFQRLIESLARGYQERNWVHEHFADLFATYLLVLLR